MSARGRCHCHCRRWSSGGSFAIRAEAKPNPPPLTLSPPDATGAQGQWAEHGLPVSELGGGGGEGETCKSAARFGRRLIARKLVSLLSRQVGRASPSALIGNPLGTLC